jgi:hypothetical protein
LRAADHVPPCHGSPKIKGLGQFRHQQKMEVSINTINHPPITHPFYRWYKLTIPRNMGGKFMTWRFP